MQQKGVGSWACIGVWRGEGGLVLVLILLCARPVALRHQDNAWGLSQEAPCVFKLAVVSPCSSLHLWTSGIACGHLASLVDSWHLLAPVPACDS